MADDEDNVADMHDNVVPLFKWTTKLDDAKASKVGDFFAPDNNLLDFSTLEKDDIQKGCVVLEKRTGPNKVSVVPTIQKRIFALVIMVLQAIWLNRPFEDALGTDEDEFNEMLDLTLEELKVLGLDIVHP